MKAKSKVSNYKPTLSQRFIIYYLSLYNSSVNQIKIKMKYFISALVIIISVTFVLSAPQGNPNDDIKLIRYTNDNSGLGDYRYT